MIKAILFDMNGVIIDDEYLHELAFAQTLESFAINLTHQKYLDCFAGKTDRLGYESIGKSLNVELPIDELLYKKQQIYLKLFNTNKKPYAGVIELIKSLSAYYLIALTSSASREEIDLIIRDFEIEPFFELTISADDVINSKPHPEPYLKTCQKLEIKPNEALVIEDSPNGVASAKAAGCFCIAITNTHDANSLQKSDKIVRNFSEITKELIESISEI